MTTVDTTQLNQFKEALKRSPAKLATALERTGVECAKILEHHLKRKAPKFLGELQSSIDARVVRNPQQVEAAVVSPVPYAHVQDEGRRPGKMPPEAPIKRWVELKLFKRAGKRSKESELRSLTFLIRRAIARKGTKPTQYIDKGVKDATPALEKRMQMLGAEIGRMLE